ncbi:MAG: DUF2207 domain-containing protein [Coriobacteriia bacterium]|nr:DUF2207 domain-containing protein [Coriobacteriia bacterium]
MKSVVEEIAGVEFASFSGNSMSYHSESANHKNSDDMEILKLQLSEWKFRLTQVWSLMTKFYLLNLIIMIVPIMQTAWRIEVGALENFLWIFPLVSAVFAGVVGYFSSIEMGRINEIKTRIRQYINENFSHFSEYPDENKGRRGHQHLPIIIFGVQLLLAITIMLIFLL